MAGVAITRLAIRVCFDFHAQTAALGEMSQRDAADFQLEIV
jgi:hypothetical protein